MHTQHSCIMSGTLETSRKTHLDWSGTTLRMWSLYGVYVSVVCLDGQARKTINANVVLSASVTRVPSVQIEWVNLLTLLKRTQMQNKASVSIDAGGKRNKISDGS